MTIVVEYTTPKNSDLNRFSDDLADPHSNLKVAVQRLVDRIEATHGPIVVQDVYSEQTTRTSLKGILA